MLEKQSWQVNIIYETLELFEYKFLSHYRFSPYANLDINIVEFRIILNVFSFSILTLLISAKM